MRTVNLPSKVKAETETTQYVWYDIPKVIDQTEDIFKEKWGPAHRGTVVPIRFGVSRTEYLLCQCCGEITLTETGVFKHSGVSVADGDKPPAAGKPGDVGIWFGENLTPSKLKKFAGFAKELINGVKSVSFKHDGKRYTFAWRDE